MGIIKFLNNLTEKARENERKRKEAEELEKKKKEESWKLEQKEREEREKECQKEKEKWKEKYNENKEIWDSQVIYITDKYEIFDMPNINYMDMNNREYESLDNSIGKLEDIADELHEYFEGEIYEDEEISFSKLYKDRLRLLKKMEKEIGIFSKKMLKFYPNIVEERGDFYETLISIIEPVNEESIEEYAELFYEECNFINLDLIEYLIEKHTDKEACIEEMKKDEYRYMCEIYGEEEYKEMIKEHEEYKLLKKEILDLIKKQQEILQKDIRKFISVESNKFEKIIKELEKEKKITRTKDGKFWLVKYSKK